MFKEMQSFCLNDPVVNVNEMTVTFHFAAEVCDMADNAIRDAIVDAAQKAGITELYLLDKTFILEAIRDKLREKLGASKWIPVTARLPEDGTTCLITIKENWFGKIEHHVDIATKADEGRGYIDGLWDTFNDWVEGQEIHVTHWMPLPDPCEEVSE